MALVKITGNVWDHSRTPIAAAQHPRLWFVPRAPSAAAGLMTGAEVQASLTPSTGAFEVTLENNGIAYRPRLDWLLPGGESEPPERRARGWEEWDFWVYPGPTSSTINEAIGTELSVWNVLVQLDPPPAGFRGWWLHAAPGDPDDVNSSGTGELRRVA